MSADILKKEREIIEIVRKNLKQLMEAHCLNVSNFTDYIKDHGKDSLSRTTFTRFMNRKVQNINLAFIVSCSHVFEVSLDNLVSPNFNPYENFKSLQEKFKNIPKTNPKIETSNFDYPLNEIFITNPDSILLEKYLQPYYCYYHSTVALENKDNIQDSLITGMLTIEKSAKKCIATLEIDTKMLDANGKPTYKKYSGDVIFCPSTQSVHCILTLPEGEFCFIIFRYSHLNYNKQECRLAEVLSTSSTPDKRYPVVHRMLLCNQEIKKKDIEAIAPHLWLNNTEILISEEGLFLLSEISEKYRLIVQDLFKNDSVPMYHIKENSIKEILSNYLKPEEIPEFLTKMRFYSYAKRYNKVSAAADETIRNLLIQRGYFNQKSMK